MLCSSHITWSSYLLLRRLAIGSFSTTLVCRGQNSKTQSSARNTYALTSSYMYMVIESSHWTRYFFSLAMGIRNPLTREWKWADPCTVYPRRVLIQDTNQSLGQRWVMVWVVGNTSMLACWHWPNIGIVDKMHENNWHHLKLTLNFQTLYMRNSAEMGRSVRPKTVSSGTQLNRD